MFGWILLGDPSTFVLHHEPPQAVVPAFAVGQAFDLDRDGFAAPADCDDRDRRVHPGAEEACAAAWGPDRRDDDCDGIPDDGCPPVLAGAVDVARLGAGEVRVAGGGIEVWGALEVGRGTILTFEPGAELVVHGILDVDAGDATDPHAERAVFASAARVPAPGAWGGVRIVGGDAHVVGLEVRSAGIRVERGGLTLGNALVAGAPDAGVRIDEGWAVLDAVTVTDNGGAGLVIGDDAKVDVRGGVITTNRGPAVDAATAHGVAGIAADVWLSGNRVDRILVRADTVVTEPATWRATGVPIELLGHLVQVASQLTIDPGVAIAGGTIAIQGLDASLSVGGTAADPVEARDVRLLVTDGAPARWSWLTLSGESVIRSLGTHLSIEGLDARDLRSSPVHDDGAPVLLSEGGALSLASLDGVEGYDHAVVLENAEALEAVRIDGFAPRTPGSAAVLAVHLAPVPGPTVLADLSLVDLDGPGLSVLGFDDTPFVLREVTVDGARGRGVELVGRDGNIRVDGLRVTGVAPEGDLLGEGLFVDGPGALAADGHGIELVGNAVAVRARTLASAGDLPPGAYTGNGVDAVLVDVSSALPGANLVDIGIPYATPGPVVLTDGTALTLDHATLEIAHGGITVVRGGQFAGFGCRIVGRDATADGVRIDSDPSSVAALSDCAVTGFTGAAVAFGWSVRQLPAVALVEVVVDPASGVRCDGPGGCARYRDRSGRPIGVR